MLALQYQKFMIKDGRQLCFHNSDAEDRDPVKCKQAKLKEGSYHRRTKLLKDDLKIYILVDQLIITLKDQPTFQQVI